MSKKFKVLIVILIVATLFLLNKFGSSQVRGFFHLISSPAEKVFWRAGDSVSDFFRGLLKAKSLKLENEKLLKENFQLTKEVANLQSLAEENAYLRKALDVGLEKRFVVTLVELIARETEGEFILVSQGEKDGILKDMVVMTAEGLLVGKVKESFASFSKVALISAKETVFDIEIYPHTITKFGVGVNPMALIEQGGETVLGLARGKGESKLEFDLVPKESKITKGDIVFTTTLGGSFPKGLLVGEINNVKLSDIEPHQRGEITPYFLKSDLSYLLVIVGTIPN